MDPDADHRRFVATSATLDQALLKGTLAETVASLADEAQEALDHDIDRPAPDELDGVGATPGPGLGADAPGA